MVKKYFRFEQVFCFVTNLFFWCSTKCFLIQRGSANISRVSKRYENSEKTKSFSIFLRETSFFKRKMDSERAQKNPSRTHKIILFSKNIFNKKTTYASWYENHEKNNYKNHHFEAQLDQNIGCA